MKKLDGNIQQFGQRRIYDWDKLLDGNLYELVKDVDFDEWYRVNVAARNRAKRGGFKVALRCTDGRYFIQALRDGTKNVPAVPAKAKARKLKKGA